MRPPKIGAGGPEKLIILFVWPKDVDYQFVEALPEELTCSICMKVLRQPHMINCCEQTFCKECLDEWCMKNSSCPHCRSTDFSTIFRKQINRKVGELKVYCPNKQHSCKAELKISEYEGHLSLANNRGCSYVELDCPNKCLAKEFRGEMEVHTRDKCPRRVVSCELCNSRGEYELIAGDHVKTCPSFPLPCPRGCFAKLIRKDLESHPSTCPLEPVPCPFRGMGCKTTVCRKDLDKHIETSTPQHMTMLAESYTALQAEHTAEHTALKAEHTALRAEHARSDNKLKAIESVLSDYQRAQIYTILTDSSTLTTGKSLTVVVSYKPGNHHIILSQELPKPDHKFKLEWEAFASRGEKASTKIKLYSISEAAYPKMSAETKFDISFNSHIIRICCGKANGEKPQEYKSPHVHLISAFKLYVPLHDKRVTIKFSPHNRLDCFCYCHHPVRTVFPTLYGSLRAFTSTGSK